MDTPTLEHALNRVGRLLDYHMEVEILLVGGAAGMLTGLLPAARTTTDCDIMVYAPADAMAAVERAAEEAARELGLAPHWLNSNVQIRRDALPDGWERRRVWIGGWGRLRVYAASRLDLIAMKVLAGRAQDLEDVRSMRLEAEDAEFVRSYLRSLPGKGTPADQVREAQELLEILAKDHG